MYEREIGKISVIQHLEELRRRIILSLIFFIAASSAAFVFADKLVNLLKRPASIYSNDFIFLSPTEGFVSYVRVALLFGFVISIPFFLFQTGLFVRPAIPHAKAKTIFIWLSVSFIFALLGAAFSYFIAAPFALRFLLGFALKAAKPMISIGKYLSFVGSFILMGAAIFQIPILMGFLAQINMLGSGFLAKRRKYAILTIFIVAAVITPTQDVINMLIFAGPMWVLFEVGVLVTWFVENKKERQ